MATLILKLGERELQRQPITKNRTMVGRDPTCDLIIDNAAVSRRHALVQVEQGQFVVYDQSSNGLYLGSKQVSRHALSNGDELQLGKFTLVFSAHGGLPPEKLHDAQPVQAPEMQQGAEVTTHMGPEETERLRRQMEAREQARLTAGESDKRRRDTAVREREQRLRRINGLLVVMVLLMAAILAYLLLGGSS